jgi:hypothetical protein
MLAIDTPYDGYNMSMFKKNVMDGGVRPALEDKYEKWGAPITDFLKRCYVDNPNRPSMIDAQQLFREEINDRSDEEIGDSMDTSGKSIMSAAG